MVETGEGAARGSLFMPVRVEFKPRASSHPDLATCVRVRRRELGLSQAQLAERVGVCILTVKGWESGSQSPRDRNRARLAEVFAAAECAYEGPAA